MAEGNNEVIPLVDPIPGDHQVTYNFRFRRLDEINTMMEPLRYHTLCPSTTTYWSTTLTCEGFSGNYLFAIKLGRMDYKNKIVTATLFVSFFGASGNEVCPPMSSRRRIYPRGVFGDSVFVIAPEKFRAIVALKVIIKIEDCHADSNWQCASKFITAEKSITENSKL